MACLFIFHDAFYSNDLSNDQAGDFSIPPTLADVRREPEKGGLVLVDKVTGWSVQDSRVVSAWLGLSTLSCFPRDTFYLPMISFSNSPLQDADTLTMMGSVTLVWYGR